MLKKQASNLKLIPYNAEKILAELEKGNLDRIAVLKIGSYLSQNLYTVAATKQYDIAHNRLEVDENEHKVYVKPIENSETGICFWAYSGKNTTHYQTFLSAANKEPKYLLLPFTNSKLMAGNDDNPYTNINSIEDMTDFFVNMKEDFHKFPQNYVKSYKWDQNSEPVDYPETMFPSVVNKNRSNCAFLISEIGYFDMKGINKSEIFQSYISILQNGSEHALNNSIKGMNSKVTGLIKDEYKENLKEYLKQFKSKELGANDEIIMYIAKLKYPYVISEM